MNRILHKRICDELGNTPFQSFFRGIDDKGKGIQKRIRSTAGQPFVQRLVVSVIWGSNSVFTSIAVFILEKKS